MITRLSITSPFCQERLCYEVNLPAPHFKVSITNNYLSYKTSEIIINLPKTDEMEDFVIVVNRIEELQLIQDRQELELILEKAKRTIIGGMNVILVRENSNGKQEKFETFSNERDFEEYRKQVFRGV
jgi:hypothetical protein